MNKSQFAHIFEALSALSDAQEHLNGANSKVQMMAEDRAYNRITHAKEHLSAVIESVDTIEFMRTMPVTCTLEEPLPLDPDAPKTVEEWDKKWTVKMMEIMRDASVHNWVKDSLSVAMLKDSVDAANDAEFLYRLLEERQRELAKVHGVEN